MPDTPLSRYPNDRRVALSLTFDDGFRMEVADALESLDPLGLRGTFFLIPELMADGHEDREKFVSWEQARAMQANGHEIGTHGTTKHKLQDADDALLDELVNGSWERWLKSQEEWLWVAPMGEVGQYIREHHNS